MLLDVHTRNFLSKLTFARVFNGFKIWLSYHLSRWLKTPILWGKPMALSIEPTTACNLGCPECPSGLKQFTRETGNLKTDLNQKIIDEASKHSIYVNFYFQGEPFINPKFLDMVSHAHSKNMFTSTSTNAHFLTDQVAKKTVESGLDRLIVSIDGVTQDVYEQYRVHGDLTKVIEGTKNILKWKKELKSATPHVIFQFLVVKPNEHQIEGVKQLAKDLGVDEIRFKTAQVYDYKHGNSLIPTIEKYSRYKQNKDGTFSLKNKMVNQCWRMWHSCVVTWDGLVVPCCFDKDATHRLGNLQETTLENVWKNSAYNNFRRAILKSRSEIDICKNCSEGTKVWA
ncbi:MAG: radical SAM/SPASM domain-containing protein [Bacteroidia bacterium]